MGRCFFVAVIVAVLSLGLGGCSLLKKKETPDADLESAALKPMPPEKSKEFLSDVSSDWFYGQGVGGTALAVGTVVLFPPYAIYLLGNGILSLSGYEPITVSGALPEEQGNAWNSVYSTVTSAPGRVNAAVAGREFVTEEQSAKTIERYLKSAPEERKQPEAIAPDNFAADNVVAENQIR